MCTRTTSSMQTAQLGGQHGVDWTAVVRASGTNEWVRVVVVLVVRNQETTLVTSGVEKEGQLSPAQ